MNRVKLIISVLFVASHLIGCKTYETEVGNGGDPLTNLIDATYSGTVRAALRESRDLNNITEREFDALVSSLGEFSFAVVDPYRVDGSHFYHPSTDEPAPFRDGRLIDTFEKVVTARVVRDRRRRNQLVVQFEELYWSTISENGRYLPSEHIDDLLHELVRFSYFSGRFEKNDDNYVVTRRVLAGVTKAFEGGSGTGVKRIGQWSPIRPEGWPCSPVIPKLSPQPLLAANDDYLVAVISGEYADTLGVETCIAAYNFRKTRWIELPVPGGFRYFERVLAMDDNRFLLWGQQGAKFERVAGAIVDLDKPDQAEFLAEATPLFVPNSQRFKAYVEYIGDSIFVWSGLKKETGSPGKGINSGAIYDLQTKKWIPSGNHMSTPDGWFGYFHYGRFEDKVFFWSPRGWDNDMAHKYSLSNHTWKKFPIPPKPRKTYTSTPHRAKLVSGKLVDYVSSAHRLNIFDVASETWQSVVSPMPLEGIAHSNAAPVTIPATIGVVGEYLSLLGREGDGVAQLLYHPSSGMFFTTDVPAWIAQQVPQEWTGVLLHDLQEGNGMVSIGDSIYIWSNTIKGKYTLSQSP